MAQILLVFLILLINGFVGRLAMASDDGFHPMVQSNPPVQSPRKLGNHHNQKIVQYSMVTPSPSPSPCLSKEEHSEKESSSLDQPATSKPNNEDNVISIKGQEIHLLERHHHSVDKSVAGGGLILGGLATTFLVAVFCYIRATGRHKPESTPAA